MDCLTTNDDDKIEKINFVRTNFKSSRGRQSFNNNGVDKSNYQSIRSDNTPYKKIENRRNFSKLFNSGSKNKTKVDMNNVTCYKCNKQGHYSYECNVIANKIYSINVDASSSKHIDSRLLNFNGKLNGIPTIFTLDTAASVTIISEKFARENKIKFSESDIKVEVANDHVIDVVGQTNELHIEIKSHTCDLNMLVLPNSNFQVLLGLNWFMESGCSVNPAKRTLQFKSEFFSLDGNEEDMSEEEEATFFADVNQGEDEDKDICQDWYGSPYTGIKPVIKFSQPQMDIVDVQARKLRTILRLTSKA